MEKKNNNRNKKPLKLSSAGRLQIRRNIGPSKPGGGPSRQDKGKTIQVVFKNRNNKQQKSSPFN